MYTLLIILHVAASACLIGLVLMQSAKGEGLSGAFGMGGGAQSLFGADTATILTKGTIVMAIIFALTCISIAMVQFHRGKSLVVPTVPGAEAAIPADDLSDTATADTGDTVGLPDPGAE
jgi:preprotein translocase subunit SecG